MVWDKAGTPLLASDLYRSQVLLDNQWRSDCSVMMHNDLRPDQTMDLERETIRNHSLGRWGSILSTESSQPRTSRPPVSQSASGRPLEFTADLASHEYHPSFSHRNLPYISSDSPAAPDLPTQLVFAGSN
ncbi:hypothetical protein HGRIS_005307 [Hohenbuehelia grisea]|uniref:Uncharacterized protein n=1 Tax=Hohenbuehelia grisea TaxID=104357 RepID=A0ABR3JG49_9AGAR